ncbi:MAG: MFS transporter [Flavobacteriaceae bacterium]|jgi:maltose/moltooligosaccharide transporter|nr:MFS transporter [Flavobacteriaceae bacterium]
MLSIQKKLTNSFLSLLSFPSTAMGFALSVQISALSWILSTQYHLEIDKIGLVWAAGPTAGILGQVIIGLISDNVWFWGGRRKPFIFIGGVLAALSLLALPNIGFIHEKSGVSLFVVAVIVALTLDLSINISFNPTRSIIADVTTEEKRTKGYTIMQTVSGSFGVLAYAIGAVWGNINLIYIAVFLVFVMSVLPMFFIEEPRHLGAQATENLQDETVTEYRKTDYPNFIKLFIAHFFTWLGVQTMFVYMFAYVQNRFPEFVVAASQNLSESEKTDINNQIGSIISISFLLLNLIGALLPAFILDPLTEKIGKVKTHFLCLFIMALAYFGIIYYGNISFGEVSLFGKRFVFYSVYIFMIIAGIGWAAIVSLPFAIMSQQVSPKTVGLFMGIFNLSVVLPQLVSSSYLGSVIKDAADKSIIFEISGFSLLVSALLWLLVKEPKVNK